MFVNTPTNLSYLPIIPTDWLTHKRNYLTWCLMMRGAATSFEYDFQPQRCRFNMVLVPQKLSYANLQLSANSLTRYRKAMPQNLTFEGDQFVGLMPMHIFDAAASQLMGALNRSAAEAHFKLFAAIWYYESLFDSGSWAGGVERLSYLIGCDRKDVSAMLNWLLAAGMVVRNGKYHFSAGADAYCYQWKISPQWLKDIVDKMIKL